MGISHQKEQQQDGTGSAFFDNLDEKIVSTRLVGLRVSKVICVGFAPELEFRKLIGSVTTSPYDSPLAPFLIQTEVKQKPVATHSDTFSSSDLFTGMSMSFVIGLIENTQLKVALLR